MAPRVEAVTPERLLTASDVADRLSVSRRWIEEATRRGEIPHVRLGRFPRYRAESIDAWVREQEAGHPVPRAGTK